MKIESHDRSIKDLLGADYYVIPRFQRPYSWDNENITDFWSDVVVNSSSDYFIGSMVVYTISGKLGVVDGQQRLTTIMILMSCLRDALEEAGFGDQASGLHKLIERENIENAREFVLQTQTSHPYFQDAVLSREPAGVAVKVHKEEERLKSAHDQFKRLLSTLVESFDADPGLSAKKRKLAKQKRLIDIRDAVLSLKLILVTLDSEDDAYLIFETLNTRGKDLALADLVKNHFSKTIKKANRDLDQVSLKWARVRETIEGKRELDTDTFIYHWWLSKHEYTAQKNIYKEFRKIVTVANAKAFLDDLVVSSKHYRAIHDPDYRKWQRPEIAVRASLSALNLFRVRQQVPVTLALFSGYVGKRVKISQISKAVGEVEKFHFIFTAITSQRSSGGISSMYAMLARKISGVKNPQDATGVLRELTQKLKERVPSEEEFLALFPSLIYTATQSKERGLVKYVLAKISRHLGHAYGADMDELTIEHLVPQSLVGKDGWDEGTIGQVGNLVLVSKDLNEKLENKNFKEKKDILRKCKMDVILPPEFLAVDELTPGLIAQRTRELGALAYAKVWKI
ncbi:MAG: DUF262 domain-containing protein [Stenotrophomonas sp.]|uniref:DUF262 domain-containing protein n=1 Tax=Stenotrophomonas sp. TaxID=69392 RepID=UPI003D6D6937